MRLSVPWLIAGGLVAGAVALALLGPGIFSRDSADEVPATAGPPAPTGTVEVGEPSTDAPQPSSRSEEPQGLSARLLDDSDGTRRNLFAMTIRDAGYDCPEVRTADTIAPGGQAWRVHCGALRLYWIEIDDFGRMSVEPGSYQEEPPLWPDAEAGGRTLTIQGEELPESR